MDNLIFYIGFGIVCLVLAGVIFTFVEFHRLSPPGSADSGR